LTLADIAGGKTTVHAWKSDFEYADCHICGYHDLAPKTSNISDLLAKEGTSTTAPKKEIP
jgi:hypothetical protein